MYEQDAKDQEALRGPQVPRASPYPGNPSVGERNPIKPAQGHLGHAKASTTLDIYGHALPEQDRDAAALMETLLAC